MPAITFRIFIGNYSSIVEKDDDKGSGISVYVQKARFCHLLPAALTAAGAIPATGHSC
jgi:hypothetical protein